MCVCVMCIGGITLKIAKDGWQKVLYLFTICYLISNEQTLLKGLSVTNKIR